MVPDTRHRGDAKFAEGTAQVCFADDGQGATVLQYDVEAKVGGKLAQLGSRITDGFTKKLADQFFQRLPNWLEGDAPPDATETPQDEETAKKGCIGRMLGKKA